LAFNTKMFYKEQFMKIAIISPGNLPIPSVLDGAIETLATHILEENEIHKKLEITVFSNYNAMAKSRSENYEYSNVIFIKTKKIYNIMFDLFFRFIRKIKGENGLPLNFFLFKCCSIIKKNHFDYVIVEGGIHQIITLKKRLNNRIILHVHADILHSTSNFAKQISDSCYKIIAVSNYIKDRIETICPSNTGKVIVLHNAVDLKRFKASLYRKERLELRKQFGIKDTEKLILFCGRIDKGKGIKELLLACEQIDQSVEYKLAIVGASWFFSKKQTEYEKEVETIAKLLQNRVLFLGYISNQNMPKYYAMADISVCPSICNDAAPLVPLEALASEIPVIATKRGGIPEYANLAACELVDCDEKIVNNIASAINLFLTDDSYYQNKKKHTREAIYKFGKEQYYNNFIDILK